MIQPSVKGGRSSIFSFFYYTQTASMKNPAFARFLAALQIAGQLAWGLSPASADTLRPSVEGIQAGLEETLQPATTSARWEDVWVPGLNRKLYSHPNVPSPDNWSAKLFVDFILSHPERFRDKDILEIGTGSLVVAVALVQAGARRVVATDISDDAIRVAEANRRLLGELGPRITVVKSDVYRELPQAIDLRGFDVIVSNQPARTEIPSAGASSALAGGQGFRVTQEILDGLDAHVRESGDGAYLVNHLSSQVDSLHPGASTLTPQRFSGLRFPQGWAFEPVAYSAKSDANPPFVIQHVHRTAGLEEGGPEASYSGFTAGIKSSLAFRHVDAVVGVPFSREDGEVVANVLTQISRGLSEFYPDKRFLVLAMGEKDSQVQAARIRPSGLPDSNYRDAYKPADLKGKGWSVRAFVDIAAELNAHLAYCDADLVNIDPSWVRTLLEPLFPEGSASCVVPDVERAPRDAEVTNHVSYPLLRALYGRAPRHPQSGVRSMSNDLVRELDAYLRERKDFGTYSGYGIDLFLTQKLLTGQARFHQPPLGKLLHTSAQADLDNALFRNVTQIVRVLLESVLANDAHWSAIALPQDDEPPAAIPQSALLAPDEFTLAYLRMFHRYFKQGRPEIKEALGEPLFREIERLYELPSEQVHLTEDLWAQLLYRFVLAYAAHTPAKKEEVLRAFFPVFCCRFASFMREVAPDAPRSDVEASVNRTIQALLKHRPAFVAARQRQKQEGTDELLGVDRHSAAVFSVQTTRAWTREGEDGARSQYALLRYNEVEPFLKAHFKEAAMRDWASKGARYEAVFREGCLNLMMYGKNGIAEIHRLGPQREGMAPRLMMRFLDEGPGIPDPNAQYQKSREEHRLRHEQDQKSFGSRDDEEGPLWGHMGFQTLTEHPDRVYLRSAGTAWVREGSPEEGYYFKQLMQEPGGSTGTEWTLVFETAEDPWLPTPSAGLEEFQPVGRIRWSPDADRSLAYNAAVKRLCYSSTYRSYMGPPGPLDHIASVAIPDKNAAPPSSGIFLEADAWKLPRGILSSLQKLAFSSTGDRLFMEQELPGGSRQFRRQQIRVFDPTTREALVAITLKTTWKLMEMASSPDGNRIYLLISKDLPGGRLAWVLLPMDIPTRKTLKALPLRREWGVPLQLEIAPGGDGAYLHCHEPRSETGFLVFFEFRTAQTRVVAEFEEFHDRGARGIWGYYQGKTLALSPDGKHLYLGLADAQDPLRDRVLTFDRASGKLLRQEEIPGALLHLAVEPDGSRLVFTSSYYGKARGTSQCMLTVFRAGPPTAFSSGLEEIKEPDWSLYADQVQRILYPGSGADLRTVRDYIDRFPLATEVTLVDPVAFRRRTRTPGLHTLSAFAAADEIREQLYLGSILKADFGEEEILQLESREKLDIPAQAGNRRIMLRFRSEDFLSSAAEHEPLADLTIVRYPGYAGGLSSSADFWNRVIARTKHGGLVAVENAYLPPKRKEHLLKRLFMPATVARIAEEYREDYLLNYGTTVPYQTPGAVRYVKQIGPHPSDPRSGLEERGPGEREVAIRRDLALAELQALFPALPASLGSQALVFRDPETFDLVPLAVQWGWAVAVPRDGPEVEALRDLLAGMEGSKGAYAIGTAESERFLREYAEQTPVTDRRQGLQLLGLRWDELPPAVVQTLETIREFLRIAVHA